MIEKMKMVCIVSAVSDKQKMLDGLRDLGLVHLAEKKAADRETSERFANLSKTALVLKDYAPKKQAGSKEILPDDQFETLYAKVQAAIERRTAMSQQIGILNSEIDRVQAWGDFSPEDLKLLKESGYDFHFYKIAKSDLKTAAADESVRLLKLASVDKTDTIAVIGTLPATIPATEFTVPEKGLSELKQDIDNCNKAIQECDAILTAASAYETSFNAQMLKAQNAENFSAAGATAENDSDFVWISGYIPEEDLDAFRAKATEEKWAWAVCDVDDEDDQVPTKVRYNKLTALIKPVFDILGILPGYRELDISLWFLLFFTLFFAMIIGDAGYGFLILIATLAFAAKSKKFNDALYLLTVLSIATIAWGAVTGTWFGLEAAMKVPFLKALVIPGFANYPEYFAGMTASIQQNNIMKFSFSIGAIHISLGCLLAIKKKISEKNLSWVSDFGWLIAVIAMYFLALNLVIGENINLIPVFAAIGTAFVLVVLFGGMAPDKTFAQGLKAGLAGAFTVFLNTISCFGNVMSYIRLFAVGMAGLAIAQSFNDIAAGFSGPLIILGMVVVLIGHSLNIVMAFLSVVVHGVRLNVLEFSNQIGMEWTGIAYEPFEKYKKIKK